MPDEFLCFGNIQMIDIADSERWGMATFRTFPQSREDLRAHEDAFVIARVNAHRPDLVQYALKIGYLLCDTLAYWKGPSMAVSPSSIPPGYRSRSRQDDDGEIVARVAERAFSGYQSHYSADPRTAPQAQAIYGQWASRLATGIVLEYEGTPVAFGCFKEPCELVLAGVDPSHAGKGLYAYMLSECAQWGFKRDIQIITGQDQVTNIAVQKVWTRMGLTPYKHVYTLHRWP